MSKRWWAFVFCLFPLLSWGVVPQDHLEESTWVRHVGEGRQVYNLYFEEALWHVDIHRVLPGRLPERQSHQVFSSRENALNFLKNHVDLRQAQITAEMYDSSAIPLSEVKDEFIWKPENSWNWDWELRFAQWMRDSVDSDFFIKYQVKTDCADVAYSLRWIFARIHKLPAANRLPGTNITFTHESMKASWVRLDTHEEWHKDKRFLAALDYLLDMTYTHSLFRDAYPIAINSEAFLPGVFHLSLGDHSGHTQVVYRVNADNSLDLPVRVIASTVPREARELYESGFWNDSQNTETNGGFLRHLWPINVNGQWQLTSARNMPFYSKEQYQPEFLGEQTNFSLAVFKRINPDFDPKLRLTEGIQHLVNQIQARIPVVQEGYEYCLTHDCSEGTPDYETWSTPSRDRNILKIYWDLENYAREISPLVEGAMEIWHAAFEEKTIEINSISYPLKSFYYVWFAKLISSDPEQDLDSRWGLKPDLAVAKFLKSVNEAYEKRQLKINVNTCRGPQDCPPGSAKWKVNSTSDIDGLVQQLVHTADQYCDHFDAESCSQFNELKNKISPDQTKNLAQWLNELMWWNPDPRMSPEERWGSLAATFAKANLAEAERVGYSESGYLVAEGEEFAQLLKREAGGTWQKDGRKWTHFLSLHPQEPWLLRREGHNPPELVHLESQRSFYLHEVKAVIKFLEWTSAGRLVIMDMDYQVHVYDISAQGISRQMSFALIRPGAQSVPWSPSNGLPKGLWIAADWESANPEHYRLVDFRGPELQSYPLVFGLQGEPIQDVRVLAEFAEGWALSVGVGRTCEDSSNSVNCIFIEKKYFLDRNTKSLQLDLSGLKCYQYFSQNRYGLCDNGRDGIQLVELNQRGANARLIRDFGSSVEKSYAETEENYFILHFYGDTHPPQEIYRYYKFSDTDGPHLEEYELPKGYEVSYASGPFVVLMKDYKFSVINAFTGEKLIQGTNMFWLLDLESGPWLLVDETQELDFAASIYNLNWSTKKPVIAGSSAIAGVFQVGRSGSMPVGELSPEEFLHALAGGRRGRWNWSEKFPLRSPPGIFLRFSPHRSALLDL